MNDKVLTDEQAEPFFEEIAKGRHDMTCSCGTSLKGQPIQRYDHSAGWKVKGLETLQWLYITCPNPKCRYQWALWKLGVQRKFFHEP